MFGLLTSLAGTLADVWADGVAAKHKNMPKYTQM